MYYKDVITYELSPQTSEEKMLKIAKQIVENWMKHQYGFIKWEIHSNNDGTYTDVVYWKSKEDAKAAQYKMSNIPDGAKWYACYNHNTITCKNLNLIEQL